MILDSGKCEFFSSSALVINILCFKSFGVWAWFVGVALSI